MRGAKAFVPLALAALGMVISARALSSELAMWAVLLLCASTALLVIFVLRPLFTQRRRGAGSRAGLPSKYERVQDPWRALSAGTDPTEQ